MNKEAYDALKISMTQITRGEEVCDAKIACEQQEKKIFVTPVTRKSELCDKNSVHKLQEENKHGNQFINTAK